MYIYVHVCNQKTPKTKDKSTQTDFPAPQKTPIPVPEPVPTPEPEETQANFIDFLYNQKDFNQVLFFIKFYRGSADEIEKCPLFAFQKGDKYYGDICASSKI